MTTANVVITTTTVLNTTNFPNTVYLLPFQYASAPSVQVALLGAVGTNGQASAYGTGGGPGGPGGYTQVEVSCGTTGSGLTVPFTLNTAWGTAGVSQYSGYPSEFNGGNGGLAAAVYRTSDGNLIAVAGGGGGGGGGGNGSAGFGGFGGAGTFYVGTNAGENGGSDLGTGGTGGGISQYGPGAGGAGGTGTYAPSGNGVTGTTYTAGSPPTGGNGGNGGPYNGFSGGGTGGGAGAGYYGGGGAGSGAANAGGGGGSGGHSYAQNAFPLYNVQFNDGGSTATTPQIILQYRYADAPLAATLSSPPNGSSVNFQLSATSFNYIYQPNADSGPLGAYKLRITGGGTTHYWNGTTLVTTDPGWQTDPAGLAGRIIIPAGTLSNNVTYAWSVATQTTASYYTMSSAYAPAYTVYGTTTIDTVVFASDFPTTTLIVSDL